MIVCNKCKSAVSLEKVDCVEVLNRLKVPCPVCFAEGALAFMQNPPGETEWEQRLGLEGYQWMVRTDRFFDLEDDMALSRILVLLCSELMEKAASKEKQEVNSKLCDMMVALLKKFDSLRLEDKKISIERNRKRLEICKVL